MPKSYELLLTENVDNLGIVGDVVTVRSGFARNYLLPRGFAVKPTEGAKKRLAERRAQVEAELAALRRELEAMVEKLSGFEVTLTRSCNDQGWLYGSVTQGDIAHALREAGFTRVLDRHIRIGQGIKRVDSYEIPIQIDRDLKTEIKLWVVPDRELNLIRGDEESAEGAGETVTERVAEGEGQTSNEKRQGGGPAAKDEAVAAPAAAEGAGKKKGKAKKE